MKAVVLDKTGKPGVLKVSEVQDPLPNRDELIVRVKYAGINYADLLSRQGLYGWAPKRPYILGLEASGVVESVGRNIRKFDVGDHVTIGAQTGAYAELVSVKESSVFKPPSHLSFEESASFIATWGTAWVALHEMARVRTGERLLIQAAAGGVGTAAVQLALLHNLDVYGTASTETKREFIRKMGAKPLEYHNFHHELQDKKPNCIIESIGGDVFKRSFDLLSPMGRLISIGATGIKINKRNPFSWLRAWRQMPKTTIRDVLRKSRAFMGLHIGYLLHKGELVKNVYSNLAHTMEEYSLHPVYHKDQIYGLSEVNKAHQFIHDRKNIGKVLLDPTR